VDGRDQHAEESIEDSAARIALCNGASSHENL